MFNLLLDVLAPHDKELGYEHKWVDIQSLTKAYADDLTLTTSSPKSNQKALDLTVAWLDWTVTMKAKPKKCYHLGMKRFDPRLKSNSYVPYATTQYSPFDAKLEIKGTPVHFIVNLAQHDEFKQRHFKFVGRNIDVSLTETLVKQKVQKEVLSQLAMLEADPVISIGLCQALDVNPFVFVSQFFVVRR